MPYHKTQNNMSFSTTVYDCGSRGGMHPLWKKFRTNLNYVSFEPESVEFVELNNNKKKYYQSENILINLENIALSDRKEKRILNVYSSPDLSSFFEIDINRTHRYNSKNIRLVEKQEVDCEALDNIASLRNENPDFLCIDTQGTELLILQGAKKILLESIIGIRCEVEFVSLYKNQFLFDQVMRYLYDLDFILVKFEKTGSGAIGISTDAGPFSTSINDAPLAWADAIFVKNDSFFFSNNSQKIDRAYKVIRYFCFAVENALPSLGFDLLYKMNVKKMLIDTLKMIDKNNLHHFITFSLNKLDEVDFAEYQIFHERATEFQDARNNLRKTLHSLIER